MTDLNLVRRLTTILALDVVAFSTMSARDEEHALALLGARLDTAGTLVRQHRGRIFKMTGDGLLAEFASPVEAIRAALDIQEAMRSANATAGPDDQLTLRIGVNLGDVVESGEDLLGDAVNVAVRLESISAVGGVCISASVYEQIVGKLMLGAEDIGEQHVKNIPRPIHAYRLTIDGARPGRPLHPAHAVARRMPRARALLAGGVAAALVLAALAGTFYLRHPAPTPSLQTAEPTSALPVTDRPVPETVAGAAIPRPAASATTPAPAASPVSPAPAPARTAASAPALRGFVAREVPFVPDFRLRALENYANAEGAKAFALNVRGIFAMATRRIDEATARHAALEDCNRAVQRDVPKVRDYDQCMLYAVGNDVVWSFLPPPMPPAPYVPAARPSPPIAFDPATAPLLNQQARERLALQYLSSRHYRALVLGHARFDWWTPSETADDTIRRNLQICGHITGRPCVVYAVSNEVLVRTPQTMRVTDVLTPQDLSGIDADQTKALEQYLIANDWRAVALGKNGRLGVVSGRSSEQDATAMALQACRGAGGTDCAIIAIGPFRVAQP